MCTLLTRLEIPSNLFHRHNALCLTADQVWQSIAPRLSHLLQPCHVVQWSHLLARCGLNSKAPRFIADMVPRSAGAGAGRSLMPRLSTSMFTAASPIQFHYRKIFDDNFRSAPIDRKRYKNTSVLLVSWADNDLDIHPEVRYIFARSCNSCD